MTPTTKRPSGMFGLTVVLAGQAISILASSMTGFALSIWVFQRTNSATSLGIMQTAFVLPYLLIISLTKQEKNKSETEHHHRAGGGRHSGCVSHHCLFPASEMI